MLFSVIIPLYNKENTIAEAVNSVLNQDCSDWELIVVNDGSTDGGPAKLKTFKDPRIKLINQENGGVSSARNKGMAEARGEYVCFLDADDYYLPNHLSSLKDLIQAVPEAGLYANGYRIIEKDTTQRDVCVKKSGIINDYFELELNNRADYLNTNSVCIPKSVFDVIGCFIPGEMSGEDTSLWLRAAGYSPVALSENITSVYRRDYSDAFVGLALNPNWSFISIAQSKLINNESIPEQKRVNIAKYINRYKLSLCRHFLLTGERSRAREHYAEVNWAWSGKRAKFITDICFLLPPVVLRSVYHRKYHGSFRAESNGKQAGEKNER
ncbi:MAG: glycosyltransferase family 2 protein [Eubacteriaceae bacterium]|nr:glycosyltransferase family 2 protein [Eubacteriaceae bacterium]